MKEGICKNCGSIVFVDPKNENCHCLFCNCVFPTSEALEIAKNPTAYTYPNEEQPEYVDEKIKQEYAKNINSLDKLAESQKKNQAKAKKKPQYAIKTKVLPDINLSVKQVVMMIAGFALIALVFLGVMLPKTIKRDRQREGITAQFKKSMTSSELKETIDFDEGFVISHMDNSHLDLVIKEKPSKEDAIQIFKLYSDTRASVIGDISEDKKYNNVSLRIAIPEAGGYSISNQNISDLENLENVEELP